MVYPVFEEVSTFSRPGGHEVFFFVDLALNSLGSILAKTDDKRIFDLLLHFAPSFSTCDLCSELTEDCQHAIVTYAYAQ